MMQLDPQWKTILRRAWSARLMLLAGVLSAAEAVVPFFSDVIDRRVFALLLAGLTFGGVVARVIVQRGLDG